MELKTLDFDLSVCKLERLEDMELSGDFFFLGKTAEEFSLVCKTEDVPSHTLAREDGWRGFYIAGVLDFSLVGILAKISGILAEQEIGLFAVSTYNTDYILVKREDLPRALEALSQAGYQVLT